MSNNGIHKHFALLVFQLPNEKMVCGILKNEPQAEARLLDCIAVSSVIQVFFELFEILHLGIQFSSTGILHRNK